MRSAGTSYTSGVSLGWWEWTVDRDLRRRGAPRTCSVWNARGCAVSRSSFRERLGVRSVGSWNCAMLWKVFCWEDAWAQDKTPRDASIHRNNREKLARALGMASQHACRCLQLQTVVLTQAVAEQSSLEEWGLLEDLAPLALVLWFYLL